MKITTKEVVPELWPAIEELFGHNGACGGCWCQAWRVEKDESWKDIQGVTAKKRFKKGILNGTTYGIAAFEGEKPIGWCNFGPRNSYPRLNRARTLKCDDADIVWSIPCFFVKSGYRGMGVASAMLNHALKVLKKKKAKIAEGYPVKPDKEGKYIPAFSWTGTISLFENAGFITAGNPDGGKRRVRKQLNK
jgi:GNAT superfamily N-acetyltransferase